VHERRADHADAAAQRALEGDAEVPALRRGGLEQRVRAGCADRGGVGCAQQDARTSVQNRLRGADRDDEVRVHERGVNVHVASLDRDRDKLARLGVVHFDGAPETARELRRHECLDLAPPDPPREAAGDEQRHAL
jgi:hypothetical protein